MADLNALIAQGAQFRQAPDPFVQFGQMQQLEQGRQTNELNRMKVQEMQQGMDETNAMRRFDPSSPTYVQDVTRINPKIGFALAKSQQEAKTAGIEGQIKDVKLLSDKLAMLPDAYRRADTPEAYMLLHNYVHSDPVIGPFLKSTGATPEKGMAQIEEAMRTGKFAELRQASMQGVSQVLESMKPLVVGPSSSVFSGGKFNQAPAAPEKPVAPPVSIAEYERAKLEPEFMKFLQKRAAAGRAPGTTVVMPTQEKAEQGARGKMLVEQYKGISDAAKSATRTLPALETQAAILDAGFKTGFGTEAQKVGASLLSALGVPEAAKYAADSEKFLGAANQAVLQKQIEQKGPQTEADAQRISQTGAQLGNTVNGNRFMIDVASSQLKRDVEQRNFYDKWWKKNGTYDGAEDAWFGGEGGKSLFERPSLKKYATPTASGKPSAVGGHPADIQAIIDAQKRR